MRGTMSGALPETVEIEPDAPARRSIVWLHGLGADGHDFEPIVPELDLPADAAVRFVFPHAPRRPVTLNGGLAMRAWYDLASLDPAEGEDVDGILDAAEILRALIARENARGVTSDRVIVAGFSQGGAIALHTGLRHSDALGGIIGLSTYLPLGDRLPGEIAEANRETPILMAHGRQDPVIPIDGARRSWRRIAALRTAPQWHEYDMAHSVCACEITDLRAWLLGIVTGD